MADASRVEPGEPGPRVFLASRNAKKLAEMQRILAGFVPHIEVLGLDDVEHYDEPAETEPTFEGNALIKARAAVEATGLPSLADDSGLCVDALNGMPGVLSARWSGLSKDGRADVDRANNELLLAQLSDVPDERRHAQFRCAVAFVRRDAAGALVEEVSHGEMPGRVIREMRGSGGFGYDVLFVAEGHDVTSAELPADEKDAISHRGEALRRIAPVVAGALKGSASATTATLHIEHPIADFALWKQAFDRFQQVREESGVVGQRIRRPADDEHYVVVDLDFTTTEAAERFLGFLRAKVWSSSENSPALRGTPEARVLVPAEQAGSAEPPDPAPPVARRS